MEYLQITYRWLAVRTREIYIIYLSITTPRFNIAKIDSAGTIVWISSPQTVNAVGGNKQGFSISVDTSDNIYIAYSAAPPSVPPQRNIYIAHIEPISGGAVWVDYDLFLNDPTQNCVSPTISILDNQYAYICYYSSTIDALDDVVAIKYDVSAQSVVWKVQGFAIDTSGNDRFPNMSIDINGNLYVTYRYGDFPNRAINSFKIDPTGNILWANKGVILSDKKEPSIIINKYNELFMFYQNAGKIEIEELNPATGATLWTDIRTDLNPTAGTMLIGQNTYACRNCTTDSDGAVILSYSILGAAIAGGTDSGLYDIVVAKFNTPRSSARTFPAAGATAGSYLTTGRVDIYTDETITALRRGEDLPSTTTTDFSPLQAGRTLRGLGRSVLIAGPKGRHLYRFTQVQVIDGPTTEGVGGAAPTWNSGWICTWAAAGIPPIL